jgi:predicted MPP superfamily phosphohydrolase
MSILWMRIASTAISNFPLKQLRCSYLAKLLKMDLTEKPIRLLQISDLHFGPPYMEKVGEAAMRAANSERSDAIIINGDLTQRATKGQFQVAKQYMERLPKVPQLVVHPVLPWVEV